MWQMLSQASRLEYVLVVIMKLLECRSVGHRGKNIVVCIVANYTTRAKVVSLPAGGAQKTFQWFQLSMTIRRDGCGYYTLTKVRGYTMYEFIIWVSYLAINTHTQRRFESSNHFNLFFTIPISLYHLLLKSDVGFITMLNVLVCEDRHVFIMYINQ